MSQIEQDKYSIWNINSPIWQSYNSLWMKDCDMLGGSYDHDKPILFI